ncbi:PPOX class F420-dependent oxidoreductase [Gordonia sp. ABSL1-1]|uniref:PPOX class F420-dependent oxidoreductase n=1 Tax=Gordonia sp. ABSL1-1 TaxID=3053923 RepID=UPI0025726180|nr:PPOX class F420-dependent oxidoreductase [Gordonia sp. ABSL1-1]MDL9938556.1 PPOX class F420-dependent oxidoreductase [Gordonia sp. ABSL1-1]
MTPHDASYFGAAATAKYVRLTTLKKDGSAVDTPVWAAVDGDRLVVWTETESWKVRRIRRDSRVVVQACDARGKKVDGEPAAGTAEVLDAAGSAHVRDLIGRKYGLIGKVLLFGSRVRRGTAGTVGIAIHARQ